MPFFKTRTRRGESLPRNNLLVLRGDLIIPERLLVTAERNFAIYGFYGISVFGSYTPTEFQKLAETKLVHSEWLAVFGARSILRADLELLDTGLAPHYDVSHTDPNFLIEKFVQCPHYLVRNPYFEPAEGDS